MQSGNMSKIGIKPIALTSSVQIDLQPGMINVKGPKGEIQIELPRNITVEKTDKELIIKRTGEYKSARANHGLYRSLIANAVEGVDKHWEKRLEIVGTGFNVKMQGKDLLFKVGYSHPVVFKEVTGLVYSVEGNNKVIVAGSDKQMVGQVAYQIKMIRKPDAYKGKGIRYEGEKIRIKPGKKAKTG